MGTDILGYSFDTIEHICRFADNSDLPPVMLLASGLQESNLDLFAHGDVNIGGSFGVFQIFTVAHGGPPERWTGLTGLDASMAEMVGRWHDRFVKHGGWTGWVDDAVGMMEGLAPDMQGSIPWPHQMAHERVSKAYAIYVLYLRQLTGTGPLTDTASLLIAADGLDSISVQAAVQAEQLRRAAGQ